MTTNFRSIFSYYGGKSKLIDRYPAPEGDLIIEPFAGSAAYAWRYHERDVWINELDPRTFSIWSLLLDPDALDIIRTYVPPTVRAGQRVTDIIGDGIHYGGLLELCRAEANQGTQGARGVRNIITAMGARCWNILEKMTYIVPRIAHWKVTNNDYNDIGNSKSTWFIDPPYTSSAGRSYRQANIDYDALSEWCQTRWGQVIVCENSGAGWLPFTTVKHPALHIQSRHKKSNPKEVVWIR